MFIISVIPIGRKVGSETLSYYIELEPKVGSVLKCPLKTGSVFGLVVEIRNIREAKHEIRSATYTIKKIETFLSVRDMYTNSYMAALSTTARHYACELSYVLTELTPKYLLESDFTLINKSNTNNANLVNEFKNHLYIEGTFINRLNKISDIIISSTGVTHIIVPSISEIPHIKEALCDLLGDSIAVYTFSSTSSSKINQKSFDSLKQLDKAVVISTAQYLCVTQNIVSQIVLESASDSIYTLNRLYPIDLRFFIRKYAEDSNITLHESDILLLENLPELPLKEATSATSVSLIDMTLERDKKMLWKSAKLDIALNASRKNKSQSFLYVNRLGLYTYTICSDCSTILTCDCGSTLVLHTDKENQRYYKCNSCAVKIALTDTTQVRCKKCNSWKLETAGNGIQMVVSDMIASGYRVFEIHSTVCKTTSQVKKVLDAFYDTPGAVLIGTELALRHMYKPIPLVSAISLDTVLSLEDYKTDFIVYMSLLRLSTLSSRYMLIQTKLPRTPIFQSFLSKSTSLWKQSYINDLKNLAYPPFGVFITVSSSKSPSSKDRLLLQSIFGLGEVSPTFKKGVWISDYKISLEKWEKDSSLGFKLRSLPSYFKVNIT